MDQILDKTQSPNLHSLVDAGVEAQDLSGIESLASVIAGNARASSVFGEPIHQGSTVIVPVARAVWGVGGGNGPQGQGQGGGGGMRMVPVGYIHIENGHARFHPIRKSAMVFGAIAIVAGALLLAGRRLWLKRPS